MNDPDERYSVEILLPSGVSCSAEIRIWDCDAEFPDMVAMELGWEGGDICVRSEFSYFDAMLELRSRLENSGILLKCNGASIDVYPSEMARQMGGGKAFRTVFGQPALMSDLVSIFETAPDVVPSTVSQQMEYHLEWIQSLKSRWPSDTPAGNDGSQSINLKLATSRGNGSALTDRTGKDQEGLIAALAESASIRVAGAGNDDYLLYCFSAGQYLKSGNTRYIRIFRRAGGEIWTELKLDLAFWWRIVNYFLEMWPPELVLEMTFNGSSLFLFFVVPDNSFETPLLGDRDLVWRARYDSERARWSLKWLGSLSEVPSAGPRHLQCLDAKRGAVVAGFLDELISANRRSA